MRREVYNELQTKDDDVAAWAHERVALFVDPSEDVQQLIGPIQDGFPNPGVRDRADPFVIAEAKARGFTVIAWRGRALGSADQRQESRARRRVRRRAGNAGAVSARSPPAGRMMTPPHRHKNPAMCGSSGHGRGGFEPATCVKSVQGVASYCDALRFTCKSHRQYFAWPPATDR